MFCKRCGAQLKESAAFCPKCGTKIVKNTLPTTEQILSNVDNLPDTEPEVKSEIRETDFAESVNRNEIFNESKQEETLVQEVREEVPSKRNKRGMKRWVIALIILFVVVIAGATVFLLSKKALDLTKDTTTTMESVEESDIVVETTEKTTKEIEEAALESKEKNKTAATAKIETETTTEAETETSFSVFVGSGVMENEGNVASEEVQEIETAKASSIEETKAPKKQTGWVKSGGVYYYYDSNGSMVKGWLNTGGQKYYLNNAGVMVTGWNKISGTYYFFDASGAMVKGWLQDGGKWYYLDSNGKMLSGGWHSISGNYYYLGSDGALWVNTTTPDGYSVDGNGRRISESTSLTDQVSGTFTYDDGETYYEDTDTGEIIYHYKVTLKMKKSGTYEIKISNGKEKTSGTGNYIYDEEDGTIDFTGAINTSGYCDGDYIEIVLDEIGDVYLEK